MPARARARRRRRSRRSAAPGAVGGREQPVARVVDPDDAEHRAVAVVQRHEQPVPVPRPRAAAVQLGRVRRRVAGRAAQRACVVRQQEAALDARTPGRAAARSRRDGRARPREQLLEPPAGGGARHERARSSGRRARRRRCRSPSASRMPPQTRRRISSVDGLAGDPRRHVEQLLERDAGAARRRASRAPPAPRAPRDRRARRARRARRPSARGRLTRLVDGDRCRGGGRRRARIGTKQRVLGIPAHRAAPALAAGDVARARASPSRPRRSGRTYAPRRSNRSSRSARQCARSRVLPEQCRRARVVAVHGRDLEVVPRRPVEVDATVRKPSDSAIVRATASSSREDPPRARRRRVTSRRPRSGEMGSDVVTCSPSVLALIGTRSAS